jgi:hypothetical protein
MRSRSGKPTGNAGHRPPKGASFASGRQRVSGRPVGVQWGVRLCTRRAAKPARVTSGTMPSAQTRPSPNSQAGGPSAGRSAGKSTCLALQSKRERGGESCRRYGIPCPVPLSPGVAGPPGPPRPPPSSPTPSPHGSPVVCAGRGTPSLHAAGTTHRPGPAQQRPAVQVNDCPAARYHIPA